METDSDFPEAGSLEDASIHAAMSADAMMENGDLDGYAVWKLIMKAVDELEAKERPGGAKLH